MLRNVITPGVLYILIVLLFTVYYMAFAFGSPPSWFHTIGAVALLLFIFRIARGDD